MTDKKEISVGNSRFKFRVWDNMNKKFQTDEINRYFHIDSNGIIYQLDISIGYTNFTLTDISEDVEINQCTGLYDKNGKLIYEGDVIKSQTYGNACGYVINWNNKGFWQIDDFALASISKFSTTDYEIIGNIYENPELLKEDENDR